MATKRQIAANRGNAGRSTGPRSHAGKKRAGRNAYRYGLTVSLLSNAAVAKQIEKLARKLAGKTNSEIILEHARVAAHATSDLARVRRVKVALIERVSARGSLETAELFNSVREIKQFLFSFARAEGPILPERVDHLATMPSQDPERTVEAVRRALPELAKLDRYESRAAARRDRAIQEIIRNRIRQIKQS
jgi:hypothetical protein